MRLVIAAVILLSLFSTSEARTVDATDVASLFQQLQDERTTTEAANTLEKLASANPDVRDYLKVHLPDLIKKLPTVQTEHLVPENVMRLAVDLRMKEAIPVLVALWAQEEASGSTTIAQQENLDNDPVGKALAKIGGPSVTPVAQFLDSNDARMRWRASLVLLNIGSPAAKQALHNHIAKEIDQNLRQWLIKRVG